MGRSGKLVVYFDKAYDDTLVLEDILGAIFVTGVIPPLEYSLLYF